MEPATPQDLCNALARSNLHPPDEVRALLKRYQEQASGNGDATAFATRLKAQEKLSLAGAPLTDAGVRHLKALTGLTALDLRKAKVSAAGIAELKQALPKCEIEWNGKAKGK